MTTAPDGVPSPASTTCCINKVLHARSAFVTMITDDVPYVPEKRKGCVRGAGILVSTGCFSAGFKDDLTSSAALTLCREARPALSTRWESSFFRAGDAHPEGSFAVWTLA